MKNPLGTTLNQNESSSDGMVLWARGDLVTLPAPELAAGPPVFLRGA